MFMNYQKILQYLSIPLISIVFFYLLMKIFTILIPFLKVSTPLIFSLIFTVYIIRGIPFFLKLLDLQPRDDWLKLLSSKNYKIRYYKLIIIILKLWNISAPIFIITLVILFIDSFIPIPIASEKFEFILLNPNLNSPIIILMTAYMLFASFGIIGIFFFSLIFSENKVSGFPDASDIPISFIDEAIKEIDQFDFSSTWEEEQLKRNRISNLMNNALEFITIQDKFFGVPHGLRYYQPFIGGLKNKSSLREIVFRINGLGIKLNQIIIDLNYMNTVEKKENISKNLIEYSNILQNRNLQEMDRVEYNNIGIIETIIKIIKPYKELIVIVTVILFALKNSFGL